MKKIEKIHTDNPSQEIWQYTSFIETGTGAKKFLEKKYKEIGISPPTAIEDLAFDFIYTYKQAKEYL